MKKYDVGNLNLKEAFSPAPDKCRDALAHAVHSIKEEDSMKRTSFRVVLITAIVIIATIAVAFAASRISLTDYFSGNDNVTMPDAAQSVLSDTEEKAYSVGPLSFTLRETLADGRIAYVTVQAAPADGSAALINTDFYVIPDSEAARLNVPKESFFADAAKQAGIPLYSISARLIVDDTYSDGEGMLDVLWAEDGSMLHINMLMTNPDAVHDSLPGTLLLYVCEIDTETGEAIEGKEWRAEDEITIPVSGVLAEKAYEVTGNAQIANYAVQGATAEQTCAGVYLTITLNALEDVPSDAHILYRLVDL